MQVNPKWIEYNNTYNEGGEGYNPHKKYIASQTQPRQQASRMICGMMRTHAEAVKFANGCLSGAQKEGFIKSVKSVFPEFYQ